MKTPSLSEQLGDHLENRERAGFARQVDQEAATAERERIENAIVAMIESRVAFVNRRAWAGDAFRATECLILINEIKRGKHLESVEAMAQARQWKESQS